MGAACEVLGPLACIRSGLGFPNPGVASSKRPPHFNVGKVSWWAKGLGGGPRDGCTRAADPWSWAYHQGSNRRVDSYRERRACQGVPRIQADSGKVQAILTVPDCFGTGAVRAGGA